MTERSEDAGAPPEDAGGAARPDRGPRHAWRLTFSYEGDEVRVVGRRRVRMQAPPDQSALVEGADDGYWLEVQDASGASVYRQVLHQPVVTEYEVFSPQGMRHVAAPEVSGVFQAVVPDLPDGDAVVLHGPGAPGGPSAAGTETGAGGAAHAAPRDPRRRRGRTLLQASLRGEAEEGDGGDR